jgi:hypothetical protein
MQPYDLNLFSEIGMSTTAGIPIAGSTVHMSKNNPEGVRGRRTHAWALVHHAMILAEKGKIVSSSLPIKIGLKKAGNLGVVTN